jgi:23S rRNA (guanosine2251-2'-O)-methyltransferase
MNSGKEHLYGLNPAFETLRAGRRKIYRAFLNASSKKNPRLKKLAGMLDSHAIPYSWVEKGRLISLCNSRENQGVVIEASPYPYVPFSVQIEHSTLLLLDNVEDPHNVGAILRSAEVFGYDGVLLASRGVPEVYPSVVKASAGATEFLNITREMSANNYVRAAQDAGFTVIALDAKGTIDVRELQAKVIQRLLLVIGGEDKSVGQYILNNADYVARLEQKGRISSLNASVAAGVAMFSLAHRNAGEGEMRR